MGATSTVQAKECQGGDKKERYQWLLYVLVEDTRQFVRLHSSWSLTGRQSNTLQQCLSGYIKEKLS